MAPTFSPTVISCLLYKNRTVRRTGSSTRSLNETIPRAGFLAARCAGCRSVRIDKELWGAIPPLINCDKNAVAGRVLPQIFVFQVNRCDLRGACWHGSEGEPPIRHRCRERSSPPLAEGPPRASLWQSALARVAGPGADGGTWETASPCWPATLGRCPKRRGTPSAPATGIRPAVAIPTKVSRETR
jgi:hypothetical protein